MFKRILVATDLEAQSRRALAIAGALARSFGSSLTVVHVVATPVRLPVWAPPRARKDDAQFGELIRKRVELAQQELDKRVLKSRVAPIAKTRCVVKAGNPLDVIVELADRSDVDLIVIGRGARGRLGPIAERVVRLTGRAVLVAPSKGPAVTGTLLYEDPEALRRARPRRRAA